MKRILMATFALCLTIAFLVIAGNHFTSHSTVRAQSDAATADATPSQRPRCSNRTASGTYGYRMNGTIVGLGPFLVNGFFVHNPGGTMRAHAYGTINGQTSLIEAPGTFTTNDDCTGTGKFATAALGVITYFFVVTDGGDQIDLLNTNQYIVLQGLGRRIAPAGRAPRCNSRMIEGSYGYRLEGSLPGVANTAFVGMLTNTAYDGTSGKISGFDTASFNGQFAPRSLQGTFKLNRDCTGTGNYGDSLGNTVNYVFTVVDGGDHLYLQGSDPGVNIFGIATRSR